MGPRTLHPDPGALCCDAMRAAMTMTSTTHLDPFACPDQLLGYSEDRDRFAILIHDGGRDVVEIAYCPWCGAQLIEGEDEDG